MSIKKTWEKYRKLLLILLIIDVLFTYMFPYLMTRQMGTAKATLTFSFDGVGEGLDPLGNPFDINEVKSDEVVENSLKKAKLTKKYSLEDVQKQITIQPYSQANILEQLKNLPVTTGKIEPVKVEEMDAGQFTIGIKDEGIPSYFETKKLLKNLLNTYNEQLKKDYLKGSNSVKREDKDAFERLDYPEMVIELEQEADALVRSAEHYDQTSTQFSSEKEGLSFFDLSTKGKLLRDQDIHNLSGMINYYMITKNVQERMQYEQIRLERMNLLQNEELVKETILSIAVGTYENSSNYLFLSSELNALNGLSQENKFYTNLISMLIEQRKNTVEKNHAAEQVNQNLERIQASELSEEEYVQWSKKAEEEANRLYEQIGVLKKQINSLAEENYDKNIGSKITISRIHYAVNTWGNLLANYIILLVVVITFQFVCVRVKKKELLVKWNNLKTRWSGILMEQKYEQRRNKEKTEKQED